MSEPIRYNEILISLLHASPYLAIELTGLVLALGRRDEDPKRFGLAAGGFGLMLLGTLLSVTASFLTPRLIDSGAEHEQIQTFFTLRWLVLAAIQCCGWVLILMALFRRADPGPLPQHQAPAAE